MAPAAKIDCGLILFDLKSSQKEKLLSGLLQFASFKWYSGSKDMYRLILVNSKKTENEKNLPNLYKTDMDELSPKYILDCIENAEPEEGDWLDAISLAIYHLKEANELPTTTLQLVYFTSLESTKIIDDIKLQKIINELKKTNIYVYIIGPDVKLPCIITSPQTVSQCMKKMILDKVNPSLVAAQKIVQSTEHSVLCDINVGINLLLSFKKAKGSQPWKVSLSLGTQLAIPTVSMKLFRKDQPLRLVANTFQGMRPVLVEDQSVEVPREDIVRGISRHGKFVQMVDRDMFKMDQQKCFEILGFTDMKFIPEIYMREDNFYVFPNADLEDDSCDLFYHLVTVLAERKKYAVAKRVHQANGTVRYNVLIPRADLRPKRFLMAKLPYCHEASKHKMETPAPSEEKEQGALGGFLGSLDVSTQDGLARDVPLGPMMMLEGRVNRLANLAMEKLLGRQFEAVGVDYLEGAVGNEEILQKLWKAWPQRTEEEEKADESF